MKISVVDDRYLIVQCENFEAGKEPFLLPTPTSTEFVYFFIIILSTYLSGFNLLDFLSKIELSIIAYGKSHPLNSIMYWFALILALVNAIYYLFLKRAIVRREKTYQIDRDSWILPRPAYSYHQNMITFDENFVDRIDSIEIDDINNIAIRVSSYYDSDIEGFPSWAETTYKVIVKFKSGESSMIESNSLGVGSYDDNQIAFRELIAKTKIAVKQIQSFLTVSKNEITPSSH